MYVFFFMQRAAYDVRIGDWSSDVCSSDVDWHRPVGHGDYQRARANAERAYANNRHCPKILSRAGTVLFFLGDKRGLDLVNRALEPDSDPEAWFYVAPFYASHVLGYAAAATATDATITQLPAKGQAGIASRTESMVPIVCIPMDSY